ncbi:hypothetical protein [Haloferax sulfurifontis]|uniref:Uncharacterized protein n=2 Tax=Haloferax sulfurifontis TaxID=255616 RepID=M0IIL6_9EURY|nr:hypothetical protein [Haloferax sulfurifontis]ELZ96626.1 hypothetical protein C441_04639 [Haloferax sulfurifontis ATCC BAA-897]GGC72368.1 hypothetical protein GCM10007209_37850 [Haloferax sulfurifontis]
MSEDPLLETDMMSEAEVRAELEECVAALLRTDDIETRLQLAGNVGALAEVLGIEGSVAVEHMHEKGRVFDDE